MLSMAHDEINAIKKKKQKQMRKFLQLIFARRNSSFIANFSQLQNIGEKNNCAAQEMNGEAESEGKSS